MTIFTYSHARQNLASVLKTAAADGEVLIRRRDGLVFTLKPAVVRKSPLDVASVRCKTKLRDIISAVRESRERPPLC